MKDALCSEPLLRIYSPTRETELHTDSSKFVYGACLLQKHDGEWHPVLYLSHSTTPAEKNYSSFELEALAIIVDLRNWRVYLLGLQFKIVTDCNAFKLTMEKRDLNARVARWALYLSEFDCSVVHKSGTVMRHVDALSRNPITMQQIDLDAMLERVRRSQQKDERCSLIQKIITDGQRYEDYGKRDVLYRFVNGQYLLVVPGVMQKQIIRTVHERGHIGAAKRWKRLSDRTTTFGKCDSYASK